MKDTVYLYVFDTMADWEVAIGHLRFAKLSVYRQITLH